MCGLTYNPLNPPTMIHAPLPKHYHHHHHHQHYNHYPPKPPSSPAQTITSTSVLKQKSQANTHCLRRSSKTSLLSPSSLSRTTTTTTATKTKTKTLLLRRKLLANLDSLSPSAIKIFYAQPYTHVVPSKRPKCDSAKYLPSIPSSCEGADEHEFRHLKRCETAKDECVRAGEILRDRRRRRRVEKRGAGGGPVTRSRARAKEMFERINTRSRTKTTKK
ncbi:hypothetical protein L873DRAFT_1806560 [Choiromyces venosus 120613-1]|uniref:Uncharacterized protein n=1 Tax=Choiromyces venosus 120613-1 TaxID=1336337 RepID=A0A3N4JRL2_9PEZI|nr:hypothetical protein L873DRAFT_1806560 [Choiromyces venosus 120613-1]